MPDSNRIFAIDLMRGGTIILMLFLNDLLMKGVPLWMNNQQNDPGKFGPAGWILPMFLFLAGMAIPLSVGNKIAEGQSPKSIARHIVIRTVSLLILGVLMINSVRVNSEFTGIGQNLWSLLMFVAVFLIWNRYNENEGNFFTIAGLRLAGIAILVALVFKFRSGEFTNNGSLITGWWGTLGIIGWGYLVSALLYLAARNSLLNIIVALLFFLTLNILSDLGLLYSLNAVKPIFGVIIEGNVPFIVLSGVLTTLIIRRYSSKEIRKPLMAIAGLGLLYISTGCVLVKWIILTPSICLSGRGLVYTGLVMIIFSLFYIITDIHSKPRWTFPICAAGENSLSIFVISNVVYSALLITGAPALFYKNTGNHLAEFAGSAIVTAIVVGLAAIVAKYKVRLKV